MSKMTLQEISKSISSGITPLRSNIKYWTNGAIPWLKTEQLGERYIYNTSEKITEEALAETSIKINPINCLSIAMYGEGKTRGNVSILKSEMATNQACCNCVIDEKKADYKYVYYFLKTQYNQLRNLSSGVRKNLNSNDIKNFEVRLPKNILIQKKIAAVLSALDDKIELNRRINAKLEVMAKTLYDYWFVQFDFPDEKGKPYRASGGKMVFNKVLKREIPEGWEAGVLGDLIELNYGKSLKKTERSGSGFPVIGSSGIVDYHSEYLVNGPGIVIGRKGTLGKTIYLAENFYPIDTTYYVNPKFDIDFIFLYYLLNTINFKDMNSDSAVPGLNRNYALGLAISLPPVEKILKFEKIVSSFFKRIEMAKFENQQLTRLRDWLLPMLMNGQVKV